LSFSAESYNNKILGLANSVVWHVQDCKRNADCTIWQDSQDWQKNSSASFMRAQVFAATNQLLQFDTSISNPKALWKAAAVILHA
jgi:hypothetical protein